MIVCSFFRSKRRRFGVQRSGNRGIPLWKLREVPCMGRFIGRIERSVAAGVQALEIEVLVIRQFRMDTHDRRHADIRADSGDPAATRPPGVAGIPRMPIGKDPPLRAGATDFPPAGASRPGKNQKRTSVGRPFYSAVLGASAVRLRERRYCRLGFCATFS